MVTRACEKVKEELMKIGLIPINVGVTSGSGMLEVALAAERHALESLWTFEHVIVPVDYASRYPYSGDGKMGVTPETPFVDPLIALAAIAARTQHIRLATGVNILPQTNPLLLAKQAASLDLVSKGRFMLGVGIGWLEEEFDALGTPFERRGARFDDYVQAMRKVWSGEIIEHESEFLRWSGFKSHPTPVQKPFPVIIGGSKGKAFERVARFGDGWFAPTASVDQLAGLMQELDRACADAGRDRATVEVTAMWIPSVEAPDIVARYEELGVSRLVVPMQAIASGAGPIEDLERFAGEVLAKLG
jgi:probable F420-dependent oxidoreductase